MDLVHFMRSSSFIFSLVTFLIISTAFAQDAETTPTAIYNPTTEASSVNSTFPSPQDVTTNFNTSRPTLNESIPNQGNSIDDILVDHTFRLIADGDSQINLSKNHTDLILVIGNTGAGKTTITKFLAQVNNLEAYSTGYRILIRDIKDQKISEGSTIISKTIFPDMIIDNETNTAFFDLPGFSDTRNASVEIANAWFMKKVADHAQRVKILFIVNYSSLRNGESRTDLKTFLEHATALIRHPSRFSSSIALVATKVESRLKPEKIIKGIASFLSTSKRDLNQVINDNLRREAAEEIIDAILSKDSNGTYNRISYFKQPKVPGPLASFPEVLQQKAQIENILHNNLIYTRKSTDDFGFSISPAAKLVASKMASKMNLRITQIMTVIGRKLSNHFQSHIRSSPLESLGSLVKEEERIKKIPEELASKGSSTPRDEFFQNIRQMSEELNIPEKVRPQLMDLQRTEENLIFFEQLSVQDFPTRIQDWVTPVHNSVVQFNFDVSRQLLALNRRMGTDASEISGEIFESFSKKLDNSQSNHDKLVQCQRYSESLNAMYDHISRAKSVKGFVGLVQTYVHVLDKSISTSNLIQLTEDLWLASTPFIKLLPWTFPFQQLCTALSDKLNELHIDVLQDQYKDDLEALEAATLAWNLKIAQTREHQENITAIMRKDFEDNEAAMRDQLEALENSNKQQQELTMKLIQQNEETIRILKSKTKLSLWQKFKRWVG